MNLFDLILPELILIATACVLVLLGIGSSATSRRLSAILSVLSLVVTFVVTVRFAPADGTTDAHGMLLSSGLGQFIRSLTLAVGVLLVLLAWPSNRHATGNAGLNLGTELSEFYALMLAALAGLLLVANANNLIVLFLAIELAAIPIYIMVSVSRPLSVAQEAGVKYFFLGAMAAALLLFGFSYLYGITGTTDMSAIASQYHAAAVQVDPPVVTFNSWGLLAFVMLLVGLCFKMAAVPLHFYAADVYHGAATPVTAFMAFVPKAAGFVALIKLLQVFGAGAYASPELLVNIIWVIAALTMTVGNVLGLLQYNVKRVLAYSSVAHTGYMLVAIAAMIKTSDPDLKAAALQGVLFYLTAYGLMNAATFGILLLLPSRDKTPATSAETYEDLAGQGRQHKALGLAMAISCFSLTGLPLTIGFFGKAYLIFPAISAGLMTLVIILVINAAISAAYYLRIIATMFLRDTPAGDAPADDPALRSNPIRLAVAVSVVGTLLLGMVWPLTQSLSDRVGESAGREVTSLHSLAAPAIPNE